ncbi:hypothetical protein KXD40_009680 [Peronospora effusa]|uniref:Uncharacterized protein n=1 Tax=Peronospora effusa TaxID=542832 RepID=A0A3R7Y3Q6_9STRA|nr:hypothetical protein DD237_008272 [Peronospora effusa]UIZ23849.1 hypothetical protein KXD40_009680 [Peronospora effusa]
MLYCRKSFNPRYTGAGDHLAHVLTLRLVSETHGYGNCPSSAYLIETSILLMPSAVEPRGNCEMT